MKLARTIVLTACLVFCLISLSMASEEITAEKLGEFYPAHWDQEAMGKIAFSHLSIPGHQKASTRRYYIFGSLEFTYYDKQDSVYDKRVAKMKTQDTKYDVLEMDGCPTVVFTKKRAIADVGGEILVYFECYSCESQEAFMNRFRDLDLIGLRSLLE